MGKDQGHEHAAAFDVGRLQVDEIHNLSYEQYGTPDGKPGKTLSESRSLSSTH